MALPPLALALLLGWSSLVLGASQVESWGPLNEMESAARKEASLVFYVGGGFTTRPAEEAISRLFEERYGIKIQWNSMPASDIPVRVITEDRTKQNIVDVVFIGFSGNYTQLNPRGVLVPIMAPSTLEKGIWRLDPASVTGEDRDWLYTRLPMSPSFLINTKLVPPNQIRRGTRIFWPPTGRARSFFRLPRQGARGLDGSTRPTGHWGWTI